MPSTTSTGQPQLPAQADSEIVMGHASSTANRGAAHLGHCTAHEQHSATVTPTFKFSVVPGFFEDYVRLGEQSPGGKVETQPGLGIVDRGYETDTPDERGLPQWIRFANYVKRRNRESLEGVSYKLLYVIRHGLGVHNVVMEEVGPDAWKNMLSHEDGDGKRTWADAHLVEAGIKQAEHLAQLWVREADEDRLPLPDTIYTSPLARCLETTKLVYTPVMEQHQKTLRPVIKELLRERLTVHTCDRRSTRSWIEENYPEYVVEDSFTEQDELWKAAPHPPETEAAHTGRTRKLLQDIFDHDDSDFISLTTHSYAVSAILAAVGAEKFRVGEGVLFPLFVKAEKLDREAHTEL